MKQVELYAKVRYGSEIETANLARFRLALATLPLCG